MRVLGPCCNILESLGQFGIPCPKLCLAFKWCLDLWLDMSYPPTHNLDNLLQLFYPRFKADVEMRLRMLKWDYGTMIYVNKYLIDKALTFHKLSSTWFITLLTDLWINCFCPSIKSSLPSLFSCARQQQMSGYRNLIHNSDPWNSEILLIS